ncbi:hypothetical protein K450DRAFT_228903 [Umbelopsis ramanniana AG]|uniref:Ima1 N-terminal domain-containing protein n=1 Tax=Umbelopsis ramanniana AG TaxID=1314678 RepID=A0AAD5EFI0_UMBRA|nr:uncharacterized protein K450DRAFT_228903 [Umbelopsis ramanniana AG]KAI8582080.1 hypothetical protein K450DRAFT_228903 [Umbelopsis ramanniana AG]
MGPLLGFILLFVFGVAVVFFITRAGSSIPTLVNCWYCNHNVFLPVNGLENVERWKCPVCDSLNVRNKAGELIDSIPEMKDPTLNQQSRVSRRPSAKTSTDVLCSNCDLAQQRILAYVTSYDPEDNDKDYLQHANVFKRKLEERYPLCSTCQQKVDNIIGERDKVAKSLMIDRCRQQLHSKPVMAIPSRQQAKRNFYIQGILFCALHITTILLSMRATIWPKDTVELLQDTEYVFMPSSVTSILPIGWSYTVPPSIIALLVSVASAWWIFWHPYQMEVYGYTGKFIPRQKTYMGIQIALFAFRLATVLALLYGTTTDFTRLSIILFILSVSLLPYSLSILEVLKHPSLFEKIQIIQEERRREIAKQSSRPYDFDWDEDLASQPTASVAEPKPALRNPLPSHYTQRDQQPEWDFSPQRFFPREVSLWYFFTSPLHQR